jgi:imidazoleglycerol phosphate synthase glutamine amidotransferase subunit HisH
VKDKTLGISLDIQKLVKESNESNNEKNKNIMNKYFKRMINNI